MVAREHSEPHRQASWLELLFDLSFVVAVAQAAAALEHSFAEGHVASGLIGYVVVFGAIWWAWVGCTWFANVFDTDDVPYRLLMIVMIAGSLGLAAGVPKIFALDFRVGVSAYVVMRLAYLGQWSRVLWNGAERWRPVAAKIIALTTLTQLGWVLFLWVPQDWKLPLFVVWFALDIATPLIAGWDARMGGHLHHIVERYGLFTIIVLGEAIAAATIAVGAAIDAEVAVLPLLVLGVGGLVAACSLWWIYFDFCSGHAPARERGAQYFWSYVHYFVFAAIAAIGAGVSLSVEWLTDAAHVRAPEWAVAMLVGGAVAVVLTAIGLIETFAEGDDQRIHLITKLIASALVIAAAFAAPVITVAGSVMAIGLILAVLVAWGVTLQDRLDRGS